jgi:nucleotide-binding universal stress UspA family protein
VSDVARAREKYVEDVTKERKRAHDGSVRLLTIYGHPVPDELQRLADRLQDAYADAVADPARTKGSETMLRQSKEAGQRPASAGGGGETRTPVPRRRSRASPSAAAG